MRQFVALAVLAAVASADGLIPPPKGKKFVSVSYEVLASKDVKGYVFVIATTSGGRPGSQTTTYGKVELDEKKAAAMPIPTGRFGYTALMAVPEEAAKEYKTDKDLFDALKEKKVKGVQTLNLSTQGTVDEKVKENKVTWTYTVTGVDDKGVKTTVSGEGYEEPKKRGEKKPLAFAEPGYLIGGLAAAVGVTAGGLWLVRRRKAA
jgi:hypothetical protein